MKKSVLLVLGMLTLGLSISSFKSSTPTNVSAINPDETETVRHGRVTLVDENRILVEEDQSGEVFEYQKNGTYHDIYVDDHVLFITIHNPSSYDKGKGKVCPKCGRSHGHSGSREQIKQLGGI